MKSQEQIDKEHDILILVFVGAIFFALGVFAGREILSLNCIDISKDVRSLTEKLGDCGKIPE